MLLVQTVLYRKSFIRAAIRQILLTAGLVILLLGINQKTCLFVEQVLPLVRQMDAAALAAESPLNLSHGLQLTVLYAVTRGPGFMICICSAAVHRLLPRAGGAWPPMRRIAMSWAGVRRFC